MVKKILFVDDSYAGRELGDILNERPDMDVQLLNNLLDAEYMLMHNPGPNGFDFVVLDATISGRLGGCALAQKLITPNEDEDWSGYPENRIIMYSARISEAKDYLKDYTGILYLDKRDNDHYNHAIRIIEGSKNG